MAMCSTLQQPTWKVSNAAASLLASFKMVGTLQQYMTQDVLCIPAGLKHSRPEWLYFWFYFVVVNSIWIVIPAIVMAKAAWQISVAITVADR